MNKVANVEGKGRDDLTLSILLAAENVIRKVSVNCSKSIRNLAEGVKSTFMKFRKMLEKYSENIESVDPQLKNNPDLVDNLFALEVSWEKGKEFLLDQDNYNRLIFFSQLIEILCEKYSDLIELIESRDPSIFVSVPGILILKCLDNEDQGICQEYNPNMFKEFKECNNLYLEIQNDYEALKAKLDSNSKDTKDLADLISISSRMNSSNKLGNVGLNCTVKNNFFNTTLTSNYNTNNSTSPPKFDMFFLYNFLEKVILFEENLSDILSKNAGYEEFYDKILMTKFLGRIKTLSMNLQREKPTEWNAFFDMAMKTISS